MRVLGEYKAEKLSLKSYMPEDVISPIFTKRFLITAHGFPSSRNDIAELEYTIFRR